MKIFICGLLAALGAAKPTNSGHLSSKGATCCKEMEITIRNNQIMMDNVIDMYQANHASEKRDTNFSTYNVTFTLFPTQEYGFTACKLKLEHKELPIGSKLWFSCRNPVTTMEIIGLSFVAISFALLCWTMGSTCWKCCGRDTRTIRRTIKESKASGNLVELGQEEEQSTQLLEETAFNNDENAILEVSITDDTAVSHASVKNDSNLNAKEEDSKSYHSNFSLAEEDEALETLDQEVAEILKAKIKRDAADQKMEHNSAYEGSYSDDNGSDKDYTDRSSGDRSYDSRGSDQESDYSDDSCATAFQPSERERQAIPDNNESNGATEEEEAKLSEKERRAISDDNESNGATEEEEAKLSEKERRAISDDNESNGSADEEEAKLSEKERRAIPDVNGTECDESMEDEVTEHKQQMTNEDSESSEEKKEDTCNQQMDHKAVQDNDHGH